MSHRLLAFALGTVLLGSIGCAVPPPSPPRATPFDREIESRAIHTSCDGGGVAARCGLILKYVTKDSFRTNFREKRCRGQTDEECQRAYNAFVEDELLSRYTDADWKAVRQTCRNRSRLCEDPVQFELLLVDSHNLNVRTEVGRRVIEEQDRLAQEQAARGESVSAVEGSLSVVQAGLGFMELWVNVLDAADKTFNKRR